MNGIIERFKKIKTNINNLNLQHNVKVVAVSKTFPLEHVKPLVDFGHLHFGENKVQEAQAKWQTVKKINKDLKLHMVGKLQSNKVKQALEIFDYIHSLDNQKLADILKKNEINFNKKLKYFIQVNLGNEIQKSGIRVNELDEFYNYCVNENNLNVIGLMVLPPNDNKQNLYFKTMKELNSSLNLKELSMGMSSDYLEAIKFSATYVRIGSSIFGERS